MHGLFESYQRGKIKQPDGRRPNSPKKRERIRADDPYFDADYSPASQKPGTKPQDTKAKKARKYRLPSENEQFRSLRAAVKKDAMEELAYGHEWRIARRMKPLGYSQRHRLYAMNPWAGKKWAQLIEQSLDANQARDGAYFVTVFREDWDFETDREARSSEELMDRVKAAQRLVRNHLRGLDFLLQLDVGLHRYARSFGRRVCVHFHGIVWGSRAKICQAMKRFGVGYSGAKGGKAKPVETWPRTVRYISKDTRAAYVSFRRNAFSPDPRPPRLFGFREPLTRANRRFLLQLFGSLTKPELCLGSGKGAEILRHARQLAKIGGWVRSRT